MMRLMVSPSWVIDSCLDFLFVASLTEGCFIPLWNNLKERSRIALNFRLLWGIIAIGDIFNFSGMESLISFHLTIRA